MKITRLKLLFLYKVLGEMAVYQGVKIAYFTAKNRRLLQAEAEAIQAARRMPKAYIESEYEKKRVELCEQYAEKTEKGKPIIRNDAFLFTTENAEIVEKAVTELQKNGIYKQAADILLEHENQLKEFMSEEVEVELHWIKKADLPAEITGIQLDAVWDLIKEEELSGSKV